MSETLELNETTSSNRIVLPRSGKPDIVGDLYKIDLTQPIADLHNELCKYYIATHINDATKYYAIILEKHNSYPVELLQNFENLTNYNIITIVAYNITKISSLNDYRVVIIVNSYDYTNNLFKNIAKFGVMDFEAITTQIIAPALKLLLFAHKHNLEIGNFAPENIIIHENNILTLRECCLVSPHCLQPFYLLPPELAGTSAYGRVTNDINADIYALGVTISYALIGTQNWLKYTDVQYNTTRLENGTFHTLTNKFKIHPDVKIVLKGLLHDNLAERWKIEDLNNWFSGKLAKNVTNDNLEAISPISFNDTNFMTCRALAYSLYLNWENALSFIKEECLIKWIQRSLIKTKSTENIIELFNEQLKYKFAQNQDRDENLFKVLTAFDKHAPIRLNGKFSITILSIPNILCASIIQHNKTDIDHILNIVSKQLWLLASNEIFSTYSKYFTKLIKAFRYYNANSNCFNLEHVLYSLTPNLPCLSKNLGGHYVNTIDELLAALDYQVTINPQTQLIDRHIVGFIYAKLQLTREQKINSLKPYPNLFNDPTILALNSLFAAQQQTPAINITNLSQAISNRLIELFDQQLYNLKLKTILRKKLFTAGIVGELNTLINIVADSGFIENDLHGYNKAYAEVEILNHKITALSDKHKVAELGGFFGQRMTVLFSYLLLLIFFLFLLSNYF